MTDEPAGVNEIRQLVHYVRLAERLRSSILAAKYVVSLLSDVTDEDPSLGPEIMAAVDSISEAVDALARAEQFAATRLEVMLDEG